MIEPLLPRGRQAGVFSPAGLGKSLVALEVAAAKAKGRSVLGQVPQIPKSVVYLDLGDDRRRPAKGLQTSVMAPMTTSRTCTTSSFRRCHHSTLLQAGTC